MEDVFKMSTNQPNFVSGQKIIVYRLDNVELGEGIFLRKVFYSDMGTTAYECSEHTILVKGAHYVQLAGQRYKIEN